MSKETSKTMQKEKIELMKEINSQQSNHFDLSGLSHRFNKECLQEIYLAVSNNSKITSVSVSFENDSLVEMCNDYLSKKEKIKVNGGSYQLSTAEQVKKLQNIFTSPTIKKLCFWEALQGQAKMELANQLKHNTSLEVLELPCNHFVEAEIEALCASLEGHPHLTTLDLSLNKIGVADMQNSQVGRVGFGAFENVIGERGVARLTLLNYKINVTGIKGLKQNVLMKQKAEIILDTNDAKSVSSSSSDTKSISTDASDDNLSVSSLGNSSFSQESLGSFSLRNSLSSESSLSSSSSKGSTGSQSSVKTTSSIKELCKGIVAMFKFDKNKEGKGLFDTLKSFFKGNKSNEQTNFFVDQKSVDSRKSSSSIASDSSFNSSKSSNSTVSTVSLKTVTSKTLNK